MIDYRESLQKLMVYVQNERFKGYDPYDILNSYISFHWFGGKYMQAIAIQIQKRNPINVRPLLGISKEYNPKALGLLLQSYSKLYRKEPLPTYRKNIDLLFDMLRKNYSLGYNGYCWGYNFIWASPVKVLEAYHPNIVVTSFVAKGIYEYYQVTQSKEALRILQRTCDYILMDLPCIENEKGICFSYTDVQKDCCYNASLLGAEVLALVYSITKDESLRDKAIRAADFVLAYQHADGHWNYSMDIDTGEERKQIDFHQGYVIEALYEIMQHCNVSDERYRKAISQGLRFYRNEQFFGDGRSKWRLPIEYPVDIHNQSQGIITFSKLKEFNEEYLQFAKTIARFTIDNMQDKNGYFYYRLLKRYKNKISYMRWSNAWMMLAFTNLMCSEDC